MSDNFSYKTVKKESDSLFKDRGSKFYGFVFSVTNIDEVKAKMANIQSLHPKARHHCYAYRIDSAETIEKANDDGEPNGSAGLPILNQLKSFEVVNTLAIVVRYFGGTKLGVSGLINAYKEATKLALKATIIIEKERTALFEIATNYEHANHVYKLANKFKGKVADQRFEERSYFKIELPLRQKEAFLDTASELRILEVKTLA